MARPNSLESFSTRAMSSQRGVYLVEDFHEIFRFGWGERRRAVGRLFNSQRRIHSEGDELRVDSELLEVIGGTGGKV